RASTGPVVQYWSALLLPISQGPDVEKVSAPWNSRLRWRSISIQLGSDERSSRHGRVSGPHPTLPTVAIGCERIQQQRLRRVLRPICIKSLQPRCRWTDLHTLVGSYLNSAGWGNAELVNAKASTVFFHPQGYRRCGA